MSIYITPQNELHVEHQGIALTCPHCQTLTHLTPVATPQFDDLARRKPKQIGIVFRCDSCGEPIFLKFTAKSYAVMRIELGHNYTEVERAPENFPLTYLPEESEGLFREALGCYSAGCFNAFGAMSRRTAQSLFHDLGERGKLELFDRLQEIRALAELDDETFAGVRAVLFGNDTRSVAASAPAERGTRRGAARGHARSAVSDLRAQGPADAGHEFPPLRGALPRRDGHSTLIGHRTQGGPQPPGRDLVLARALRRRTPARCGIAASTRRPHPSPGAPTNVGRFGTPAPDAASAR